MTVSYYKDNGKVYINYMVPNTQNYWGYEIKSNDAIHTPDGKNIIIDTKNTVADCFPLYDDTMIEVLKYLDVTKEYDGYNYNQRLDGVLLLHSILQGATSQFNEVEQDIFNICLPEVIQKLIRSIMQQKVKTLKDQQKKDVSSVLNNEPFTQNNAQQSFLTSLKNHTQTMYGNLKDKLSTYRQELIFGLSSAAAAVGVVAAYKYLTNK